MLEYLHNNLHNYLCTKIYARMHDFEKMRRTHTFIGKQPSFKELFVCKLGQIKIPQR